MIRKLALLGAAFGLSLSAAAVPTSSTDIARIFEANGITNIEADPAEGDFALVSGSVDIGTDTPVNFTARVMRCEDGANCRTVLMFANFDLGREVRASDYVAVNGYNDSFPYGRGYVYVDQDGMASIGVDYVVDLEDENAFGENEVETFQIIVSSFIDHISTTDVGE